MAKACAVEPTGMSAVLGGDEAEVLSAPRERSTWSRPTATPPARSSPRAALTALDKLAEDPPEKARVRQLATAGAFHTHYMAPATDGYAAAAQSVATAEPTATLLSQRRRPAGRLGGRRHEQAGRPADPAGALGPVHRDAPRSRT